MNEQRRIEDKKAMRRRSTDSDFIYTFDRLMESRMSTVLNWIWKSGLLIALITLVVQNLDYQRKIFEQITNTIVDVKTLKTSNNKVIHDIQVNSSTLSEINIKTNNNRTDIVYLRRDVDCLLENKK